MKTKIFFDENDDIIDICYDNVFKAVFTKDVPESRTALSRLVSAFIGQEVSIIEILANEPPARGSWDRQIRYDINCRALNGELIDVEMGLNPDFFEPVRLEYHAARLFTEQNIKGTDKSYNDLKRAYQITILAKEKFFQDGEFFHTFEYYDPIRGVVLGGRSRIITMEMSKLEKIAEKETAEMNMRERWAVFFKYLTDKKKRSKINEIIEQEEGIAMASEVVMGWTQEEKEALWKMSREKAELDYQSWMTNAKRKAEREGLQQGIQQGLQQGIQQGIQQGLQQGIQQGIQQGLQQGIQQGKIDDVRRALAKGYPLEDIQDITGLDLEIIKSLQTEMKE
jgi:predicted transposase/invertase (TIGR01784 family)